VPKKGWGKRFFSLFSFLAIIRKIILSAYDKKVAQEICNKGFRKRLIK